MKVVMVVGNHIKEIIKDVRSSILFIKKIFKNFVEEYFKWKKVCEAIRFRFCKYFIYTLLISIMRLSFMGICFRVA